MTDESSEWEAIGRQLLYNELSIYAQERLEKAMNDVAGDIYGR